MLRQLFVIAMAALVLSVPARAQPPWQPPRTPDGQPDMQGIWQNDTFEMVAALLSLEGDHSRWPAEFIIDQDPATATPEPPQWPTYIIDPPEGKIPYQSWAVAKRQEFIANMLAPTKREHLDPNARGLLLGVPRVNHMPPPFQVLQVPGYVVLLYEANHGYRVIPLDDRPHVGESITLFNGDSRGRWEGNTLVVNVTNQNDRTWLDWLSFHGEGLRVVERWTPVGPDRIEYRATLTDPTMFTRPWTIAYGFYREKTEGFEILEDTRIEGERDAERMLRGGGLAGRRKE
jgi:hypothetical protein